MKLFIALLCLGLLSSCVDLPADNTAKEIKQITYLGDTIEHLDHTIKFLSDCQRAPHAEWVAANCDARKIELAAEGKKLKAEEPQP